jgi:SAM-dependent methyltransferase
MAKVIEAGYRFNGKRIVDFGCGYGDMMNHALRGGAWYVLGVDKDQGVINTAAKKCNQHPGKHHSLYRGNFEDEGVFDNALDICRGLGKEGKLDTAFCFSVLPYLEDATWFVNRLRENFKDVFIECQYIEDGPGKFARDDGEMSQWLRDRGFDIAMHLGRTFVKDRNKYRSIWRCYEWSDR